MGRGDNQRLANNLLYGPRVRGLGPEVRGGPFSFEQLTSSLDDGMIPRFLSRAVPGLFLTRSPSVYKHIALSDSRIHEYRFGCHGRDGELVVALSQGEAVKAVIDYQDSDIGLNDVGPGSESEQGLLASLARNIAEPIRVEFILRCSEDTNQLLAAYRPDLLRLGSLRYGDNSSQAERFRQLAEDFHDYPTLGPQLDKASSLSELLNNPFGSETLGAVADNSLLALEGDLTTIAGELRWDAAS